MRSIKKLTPNPNKALYTQRYQNDNNRIEPRNPDLNLAKNNSSKI